MKYLYHLILPLLMSTLLFSSFQNKNTLTLEESKQIFDYAYPLVIMDLSQDLMLNNPLRPHQLPNSFVNITELAQPKNKAVVLGNRNTLYTVGWIDLSKGPVVFTFPDMDQRYFVMPLIDAWSNTFKSIGSRTTGQKAQKYFLVNDAYTGDIPKGFTRVECPTNMVWITGRIQADNDKDAEIARALQAQFVVKTYSEFQGNANPFSNWKASYSAIKIRKPVPYTFNMKAKEYYDVFFSMWANNASLPFDTEMVTILKRAGIERGKTLSFKDLSDEVKGLLTNGLRAQQDKYSEDFYKGSSQTTPWIFNKTAMGTWGDDYAKRTYWAMWGLGANLVDDAVYGVTQLDHKLTALNGENVYTVHFEPGGEPEVGAFWSITCYDIEGYLETNSVNRYASGSNMPLTYNSDKSLDLYISHVQPEGVSKFNWIPSPEKSFKVLFRMYWPKQSVLDGTFKLPAIEKE